MIPALHSRKSIMENSCRQRFNKELSFYLTLTLMVLINLAWSPLSGCELSAMFPSPWPEVHPTLRLFIYRHSKCWKSSSMSNYCPSSTDISSWSILTTIMFFYFNTLHWTVQYSDLQYAEVIRNNEGEWRLLNVEIINKTLVEPQNKIILIPD